MNKRSLLTAVTALMLICGTAQGQSLAPDNFERQPMDRMAAWNYSLVRTYELAPVSRLLTYVRENYGIQYTALARIVPQIEVDGKTYSASQAENIQVEDFPGGVVARFTLGGVRVETRFTPLLVGQGEPTRVGAAVYRIETTPATPVQLIVGESYWQRSAFEDMNKSPFTPLDAHDNRITRQEGTYLIRTAEHGAITGVRTKASVTVQSDGKKGEFMECSLPKGSGELLLTFAEDPDRVLELSEMNPDKALANVERHYDELLSNRIETPDTLLNQAFASALLTLEYTWVPPYGWMECIHHWTSMWHMQQTVAAEWLGQTDRSRITTLTQGELINSDGSIPHLAPFGFTRRDFGGTNQFWAWQVRHYWNFTADESFAKTTAPLLERVIGQTFEEYDKNDNLLLGWGLQIGNQEDYVATAGDGTTPSIEGVNMMNTRAELAAGLGDSSEYLLWKARADEIRNRLREKLWQNDLGRFAYFADDIGNLRRDGQYHTYTYPAIYGITDLLDSYTSLRHLSDRLTDSTGAVYCSNNFPYHAVGTWGMQAGAAQQPWASWGYASIGLRNRAWEPLHALAGWVMDANHRGSWPEVSKEAVPAYFSAPAGLYVAAVAEALFGLQMHKPDGYISLSPNFPDAWPAASLELKNHKATFRRDGNRLEYNLRTTDKLARRIRWSLPVCTDVKLTNHGHPVPVTIEPGIGGLFAVAELPAENESQIVLTYEPVAFEISAPGSVAEGDALRISVNGATLQGVEDRSGLLGTIRMDENSVRTSLKTDLLTPYSSFGPLGELNFGRRTFFLICSTAQGDEFYAPVDLTVLPRFEALPQNELQVTPDKITTDLLIRNNTTQPLTGEAVLRIGDEQFPLEINVGPRDERTETVAFEASDLSLFAPGSNRAQLTLPNGESISLQIVLGQALADETLNRHIRANLVPITIDSLLQRPDKEWQNVRKYQAFYHPPWNSCPPPMQAIDTTQPFDIPQIPGLSFQIPGHRFAALSSSDGTPVIRIPVDKKHYKKLYLLVVPLLDNADMFSHVARITVKDTEGGSVSRMLSFPGDLDWSCPPSAVGRFATSMQNRPLLVPTLPLLPADSSDRVQGAPPAFPQPELWSGSASVVTRSGVFSVIELDLECSREVQWIELETLDAISALGLVAVTGYTADNMEQLEDTPWFPPAHRLPPVTLFDLDSPEALEGWTLSGEAFSVAPVPALFNEYTLNSLAKNGETAQGRALSPVFRLPEWCSHLKFDTQGGTAMKNAAGEETLCIRLLDADTGEELTHILTAGVHYLAPRVLDVSSFHNRNLRLEMVDLNDRTSYAWIGLRRVRFTP